MCVCISVCLSLHGPYVCVCGRVLNIESHQTSTLWRVSVLISSEKQKTEQLHTPAKQKNRGRRGGEGVGVKRKGERKMKRMRR